MQTFQLIHREQLSAACRERGIKYSKMTVAQMRDALSSWVEPIHPAFASDNAEEFWPAEPVTATPTSIEVNPTPLDEAATHTAPEADPALPTSPAQEFDALFNAATGKSKCAALRYVAHRWTWSRKDYIAAAGERGVKPATASANYAAAKRGEE